MPRGFVGTTTDAQDRSRSDDRSQPWKPRLAEELETEDRQQAYRVLRAFLHALRDHLPVNEVAELSAQLPILVRGIFYEGWEPGRTPERARDLDSFLARIANEAQLAGETEASFAAAAASRVLERHVSAGEAESVLRVLPEHLREFLRSEGVA